MRRELMSGNKATIERYIDGFNKSDHAQILSCLTNDIEWLMPGGFHLSGKEAFDKEIENDAFTGNPDVAIVRMVEEADVVVAEGTVRVAWKAGGVLNAVFCDVFEMRDGRIRRLTTYQVNLKERK
jgi:ketosteroid isomerase-like protein